MTIFRTSPMSTMGSMSDHQSSSLSRHQVFISFRGGDVRQNFLQCFKATLDHCGFDAFLDAQDIRLAESIHSKIFDAITHAQVCVPIFSLDFASSTYCLMEVTHMVKLNKTILPIFYGVKPSVVRYQSGTYEESFREHTNSEAAVVQEWREALGKVSNVKGEELIDIENNYHNLIEKVVDRLWELLGMESYYYQDPRRHFVSISHHEQKILRKLDVRDGQVKSVQILKGKRVVVISGLPGIGKTTLAKVMYNRIRPLFGRTGSCFLGGIRDKIGEGMLLSLQKNLIQDLQGRNCPKLRSSNEGIQFIRGKFQDKGVFLVLDDVDDFNLIERSMGGLDWIGPGSRIIVTTRKKDIINHLEADDREVSEYEIGPMPPDKAHELFNKHAFRRYPPSEDFASLAKEITSLLGGNPYSITLVGLGLRGNDKSEWKGLWTEMRENLKDKPEENILQLLKLTYEKFDQNTKHIFLDTACLFNGMDKRLPSYLWKACNRYPDSGIYPLYNASWLKLGENNELLMPRQIEILGKRFVYDEDPNNPLNRTRVWNHEDVSCSLEEVKEQDDNKVEALCLASDNEQCNLFSFRKLGFLAALRFLSLCTISPEPDSCSEKRMLPKLVWLAWNGCRQISYLRSFHVRDLVILDLSARETSFTMLTGENDLNSFLKEAKKLKVLNLSGHLRVSLDFRFATNLEQLILERCLLPWTGRNLSVSSLQKLHSLNIKYCKMVKQLPGNLGEMKALTELLIDGTDIKNIVLPNNLMKRLDVLSACDCKNLVSIPEFPNSSSMRVLNFKGCEKICCVPDSVGQLSYLKVLDLSETMITCLNSSFDRLEKLEILRMRRTRLEEFPRAIHGMTSLREIDFSDTGSMLGECDATKLSSLMILKLSGTQVSDLHLSRTNYCNLEILEYSDNLVVHLS